MHLSARAFDWSRSVMDWRSEYSPEAPMRVRELIGRRRRAFLYFAREPYETRVSAASMTPPRYLIPSTDVPVVMGRVVIWFPPPPAASIVEDAEGRAREEAPPDWRDRDMTMRDSRRDGRSGRDGMVEISMIFVQVL